MKTKAIHISGIAAVALAGSIAVSSCGNKAGLEGTWVEPVPGMEGMFQGFDLEKGGKASSVNMATLRYETWAQEGDRLILSGESIGNGVSCQFSDTLTVLKMTTDSLILKKDRLALRYSRVEGHTAE